MITFFYFYYNNCHLKVYFLDRFIPIYECRFLKPLSRQNWKNYLQQFYLKFKAFNEKILH